MEQIGLGIGLWTMGCARLRLAVDTHAITSHCAIPLLIKTPGGLVVEVNDGTAEYNGDQLPELLLLRPGQGGGCSAWRFALAHELKPHGATAVSLTPGWLRSEAMLEAFGVTESNWRDATSACPASLFPRVPRSSAGPWRRWRKIPTCRAGTGKSLSSGQLAKIYGFTDLDGSQPDAWRYMTEVQDAGKPADVTGYR